MKNIINVLDSSVYNHIAAGEVVERPASVVKELVENSIDALSKRIDIEIENGGVSKIKVSDDGLGISKEFLKTAFLPHATSKVKDVDDLDSIATLGFRGEALASIAAVAKVSMTSRTKEQETAAAVNIEGGKFLSEFETGRTFGTTTIVSDLFYNVPARKKFLKKEKSEEQEVTALVSRFILAHPEISFTYIANGKTIYQTYGTTLKEAVFSVYGKEAMNECLEVGHSIGGYTLSGFVGRPSFSKPNRTYQTLVINGRYVVNSMVSAAITNAYADMLMKRKYPFFVLHLNLPFEEIDVNVHPNKLDVRFANSNRIYSLFFEAVSRAISRMDYVPEAVDNAAKEANSKLHDATLLQTLKSIDESDVMVKNNFTLPTSIKQEENKGKVDKMGVNLNPFSSDPKTLSNVEREQFKEDVLAQSLSSSSTHVKDGFGLGSKLLERLAKASGENKYKSDGYDVAEHFSTPSFIPVGIKKVGKIFNTYLLVEVDDDVFFIDQHAAHERLLYEKFKAQYDSKNITIQPLLFPYVLSLNPLESNILESNMENIRSLGFEIDEFGNNTYKVNAVPSIVSEMNFDKFFDEFLTESKNAPKKSSELIRDYLMQRSCKSAIKGGNDLTELEINTLFSQMSNEKIALFCPHGRPIAIRLSKSEIDKWFKRIV